MSGPDIFHVKEVLGIWLRHVNRIIKNLRESAERIDPEKKAKDLEMCSTYHTTLKSLNDSINEIEEEPSFQGKVLLAKDSAGKIQAALTYHILDPKKAYVTELLSAPWNLRWNTHSMNISQPLRGGGVMLMDALCKIALKGGLDEVFLLSEEIARPFYTKIGMTEYGDAAFTFYIKKAEDQGKIQSAMHRAFGKDFHYSLLTET